MKELNIQEISEISGGISDDAGWTASIGVSAALIGVAIATTGPIAMVAVLGSYAASYISTRYLDN